MLEFAKSQPAEIAGVPSAEGNLPAWAELVGRPCVLPIDILWERDGPIFYADFSGFRKLYACSLELVDELCDESRFTKNVTASLARSRALVGDGLFTAYHGEPNWQKAHDVLLPGFSYNGLRQYHDALLEINYGLTDLWDSRAGGGAVDVATDLQKLAMDSVALAGFGERFNSFQLDGFAPFPQSFLTASALLASLEDNPDEFATAVAELDGHVDALFQRHDDRSANDPDDLLFLMLAAGADGRPKLDRQNIRNQILTFLIAGQLTTSELMPNTLYNLLRHPAVLHRVQAEVDQVFGDQDDYRPTYDDIGKLRYLRQAIDETLRISPPANAFDRMALQDTVIGGRYPVKRGEVVSVLVGALHRQPEWGDNVELFDPERFDPERAAARPASLFKPFGTGARSCIGRQFALHEATMAIARLVHRYRFVDSKHYVWQVGGPTSRKPVEFHLDLIRRTPEDRRRSAEPAPSTPAPNAVDHVTAVRPGTTMAVLTGSNLGTCRSLATYLADRATELGFTTTLGPLDDAAGGLPAVDAVLVVTSSYNGQPTDDAREFMAWLADPPSEINGGPCYAVLGVGDRNWAETYQAIPRRIDERLAELGAERVLPRAEADTSGDLIGTVEEFSGAFWTALAGRFGDPDAAGPVVDDSAPLYKIQSIVGAVTSAIDARFHVVPMTVLDNIELVDANNPLSQAKRHVRIALPEGVGYQTGDHLSVLADNPPALVNRVLELTGLNPDLRLSVSPQRNSGRLIALDREVSVRELLTHFVELRKPATSTQLRRLAASNACPPERQKLEELAESSDGCVLSPLECLLEFPACKLTGAQLLELLEPMTPRHYSIASSARSSPQVVSLVVSVLETPARSGYGIFSGVASSHLAAIIPGEQIRARVDRARDAFRAGADPTRNVILVSAGTGVAPFCGFLGDRLAAKRAGAPYSPALCFFGVRHPDVDYIFRDQFEGAEQQGIVKMRPAFSRAPENGVHYVQDRIAADADEVWALIGDPAMDAYVYVCGDGAKMAPSVRQSFLDIYRARTGADDATARDWLAGLVQSDHFVEDVWAE